MGSCPPRKHLSVNLNHLISIRKCLSVWGASLWTPLLDGSYHGHRRHRRSPKVCVVIILGSQKCVCSRYCYCLIVFVVVVNVMFYIFLLSFIALYSFSLYFLLFSQRTALLNGSAKSWNKFGVNYYAPSSSTPHRWLRTEYKPRQRSGFL